MNQLTTKQQRALKSVQPTYQAALYLDAHPSTLAALARRGLIDRKWSEGTQRNDGRWTYRINGNGIIALRGIRQDEESAPAPTVEDRIRDTYESLSAKRGAWVGLRMIRNAMPDVARVDLDAALLKMVLQPGVMLDPEFNQKTLTAADRDASIRMGGENMHLLSIGRV